MRSFSTNKLFQLLFIASSVLFANEEKIEFDIKNTKQGLSDNDISYIANDGHGFLWLGTNEGLNRYDGYEFKTYQSNFFDSTALSGNVIWSIFKDSDGDIWVGTDKGIDQYINGLDQFKRYDLGSKPVNVIQDETNGSIIIASENTGLHFINKKDGSKRSFKNDPNDGFSISSNSFNINQHNPIAIDELGNIWVATDNGLNYYRKDKDIFTRFNQREGLSGNKINTLMAKGDYIYVGSSKGLDRINIKSFNIEKLSGNVWFSFTGLYGVNKIQPIWADHYFKTISNAKMGLNLSRGDAIKYYSSDRITQIVGNGLVCLIDEKTQYRNFFNDKEMIFYKNINDLSEKILEISSDDKKRKMIAKKGKEKYMKYFNSNLVAEFIIDKSFNIKNKKKYYWES